MASILHAVCTLYSSRHRRRRLASSRSYSSWACLFVFWRCDRCGHSTFPCFSSRASSPDCPANGKWGRPLCGLYGSWIPSMGVAGSPHSLGW
ncbi:hypothetical protein LINGRAHAP2_LOCUS9853 [Linum grandiflorum]